MYILKVYSVRYTLRLNTNVKKIFFGQNERYKKCPLFLPGGPTHYSFKFKALKHKVRLLWFVLKREIQQGEFNGWKFFWVAVLQGEILSWKTPVGKIPFQQTPSW